MEGRSHSSAAFIAAGSISRMQQDLMVCSRDHLKTFQPRTATRPTDTAVKPHVGVIGAGLAGLRCAEVLLDGGAQVTLLEARDRIGGRIHQAKLGAHMVDMGANWVHGTDGNPIQDIAKQTGTSLCHVADDMHVFDPKGVIMDKDAAEAGLETVWTIIEEAFRYSNNECLGIRANLTLEDYFHEKLARGSLTQDQRAQILLLAEMWGSFIGDSWTRQSLRWFWLEECLDGENFYVMDSHAAILQHIAAKSIAQADIHLSTCATGIESLDADDAGKKVVVTTNQGSFKFDEVVIAIPLGCLQQDRISFVPALPRRLQTAIRNASYSSLEKIYFTFPTAFWDQAPESKGHGDGDAAQTAANLPSFAHFLRPEYVPDEQKHWTIEMVPLSCPKAFSVHARPTLLFYTHDPCAAYVCSLIRGMKPGSAEYMETLDRFFRPYYSRLPNYQQDHLDCKPTAILATDWHGDDLAGNGSYTNFQASGDVDGPDQILLDEDVRVMRAGLSERRIWLAGEHTAPFVGLGTTTGAYWSGEAAAVRILAAYGMMKGDAATERHLNGEETVEGAAPKSCST